MIKKRTRILGGVIGVLSAGAVALIAGDLSSLVNDFFIVSAGIGMCGGSIALFNYFDSEDEQKAIDQPTIKDMLEKVTSSNEEMRNLLLSYVVRMKNPTLTMKKVFQSLTDLTKSLDGVVSSPSIANRVSYDGDISLIVRISDTIPELVESFKKNSEFYERFDGEARRSAESNMESIIEQSAVLEKALDRVEEDIVKGETRSIEAHGEFLKQSFERKKINPIIDLELEK